MLQPLVAFLFIMKSVCIDCGRGIRSRGRGPVRCMACWRIHIKTLDLKGVNCGAWKGGRRKDRHGYIQIHTNDHPRNSYGYVREHRLIMEGLMGRLLKDYEVVHHKNGKKDDNRPENLELLTKKTHSKLHSLTNPFLQKQSGGKYLVCTGCKKQVWKNKYYIENKYKDKERIKLYKCRQCGGGGCKGAPKNI